MLKLVLAALVGLGILGPFLLWPICVPLTAAEVAAFEPPIEQRTDRDFHLQVFQRRDGTWCQCKTRLARAFFF
ncbi:MAG: hypothetical protein ABI843_16030 [Dokdonella sp.]